MSTDQRHAPSYVALLTNEAKRAYSAYGKVTGGKNYQGLPMPKWDDLPEKIQEAWRSAADAIITGQVTH